MPFLLNGNAIDFYHSLTEPPPHDCIELNKVMSRCFDGVSSEPIYLSRALSLHESMFAKHTDYIQEFRTSVIKLKVNLHNHQMGHLVASRFVAPCGLQGHLEGVAHTPVAPHTATIKYPCFMPCCKTWHPRF